MCVVVYVGVGGAHVAFNWLPHYLYADVSCRFCRFWVSAEAGLRHWLLLSSWSSVTHSAS